MEPQPTESVESTSVDILVERIKTHPEEFFNKDSVVSRDGEKIFAHTKWRRITTLLLADAPAGSTDNLWLNLFKPDEVQRFRAAMYAALRAEIDTTIVKVLVGESPDKLNPDAEEATAAMEAMNASMAKYRFMAAQNQHRQMYGQPLSGVGYDLQNIAAAQNMNASGAALAAPSFADQPPAKPTSIYDRFLKTAKTWGV